MVMMSTTKVNMDVGVTKPVQGEILGTGLCTRTHSSTHTPAHTLQRTHTLLLTCAYSREEQQPEETEDGRGHHLIDGSGVDLLVEFRGQVSVIHIVTIH